MVVALGTRHGYAQDTAGERIHDLRKYLNPLFATVLSMIGNILDVAGESGRNKMIQDFQQRTPLSYLRYLLFYQPSPRAS